MGSLKMLAINLAIISWRGRGGGELCYLSCRAQPESGEGECDR